MTGTRDTRAQREDPKPAHAATIAANAAMAQSLPFADQRDFEDARRGLIAEAPRQVANDQGRTVWDTQVFEFVADLDKAPDTVNPSLWRQAQLNRIAGLFVVCDRVYQVRGLDLSNMTIIEGESGLIIIDPVTSVETARACIDLFFAHRPHRPVVAVIYSHSHPDHYGGVKGVIDEQDVAAGKVRVIAPDGFLEAIEGENVLSGTATYRRAQFQFGTLLQPGIRGAVDTGLGKTVTKGARSLIAPTQLIADKTETHVIDGVEIEFYMAPDSEAPAEMHMFFPGLRVLNMAENVTHNLHNFCPIRGAVVRDPLVWSKYIGDAIELYADKADVLIAQHHWPTWGRDRVMELLSIHRDLYKFIHDQTLRGANRGGKPDEIAENLTLPEALQAQWSCRGYYGTVNHNSKAVYQRYLSWYDGNPANLHPLPSAQSAQRTIDYMGGAEAVLERAQEDFDKGEFRWVTEIIGKLVYADPANAQARDLLADAYEQLGYQSESGTWRNAYLYAAQELRQGVMAMTISKTLGPDLMQAMSVSTMLDYLGVRLIPEKVRDKAFVINLDITDRQESLAMTLSRGCLTHLVNKFDAGAVATMSLTHAAIARLAVGASDLQAEEVAIKGDKRAVETLFAALDDFNPMFNVVTPAGA
ncbi:alkyl/aryl-sulfatase [Thalassovita sp.]|uniref:alkyl/aryl-sulfatase n=1 Tax=Thalassovita sp. TaxID=1979401 RepID=UPI0029DE6309|nr:alkyl sulfatase dimerization domain-containing protein [Thalassovita sp.]